MTRHYLDLGCATLCVYNFCARSSDAISWGGGGEGGLGCLGKQAMTLRNAGSGMEMLTLQFSILYYKTISYRD